MSAKILVVDDSNMIRMQVGRALKGAGFTVIEAKDGMEALEKLASDADARLVVCDVNMPRMSGVEFLEAAPRTNGTLNVPVVMLTTEGQPDLVQKAKALGAKGWIMKPFKPELLIATAKKLTEAA
jgi:two-component system chemotaxis response regulator CheY